MSESNSISAGHVSGRDRSRPGRLGARFYLQPWWAQIRHQWAVSLLVVLALTGVVALHSYTRNSARFQLRSMQLIMKEMGHNLWFVDRQADPLQAASGYGDLTTFPVERIATLTADRQIASTYWANVLQAPATVRGRTVLLSGLAVWDDHQVTEEKAHLLEPLEPGTVALGYALGRDWQLHPGDVLEMGGDVSYRVQKVYPARSTLDDERLWLPLTVVQEQLDKPDQVNLVLGFLCMQGRTLEDGLARLENRLADQHPAWRLLPQMNVLNARALSRLTTARYLDYLLFAVAMVTVLMLAVLGWMEINERRYELAVLMALGAGHGFLYGFFLTKLLAIAVVAATAGFLLGSQASVRWLSHVLVTHTQPVAVVWSDYPVLLALTVAAVAAASLAPLIRLLRFDPTRILAEE